MAMRDIDLTKPLTEDEARYVRERPWIGKQADTLGLKLQFPGEPPVEDDEDETDDEPIDDETEDDTPEDYSDESVWVKRTLQAEIDRRNESYNEDEQIVPDGTKRADLVAALIADDEELAAGEDDGA